MDRTGSGSFPVVGLTIRSVESMYFCSCQYSRLRDSFRLQSPSLLAPHYVSALRPVTSDYECGKAGKLDGGRKPDRRCLHSHCLII